jgi:hypothetical protein
MKIEMNAEGFGLKRFWPRRGLQQRALTGVPVAGGRQGWSSSFGHVGNESQSHLIGFEGYQRSFCMGLVCNCQGLAMACEFRKRATVQGTCSEAEGLKITLMRRRFIKKANAISSYDAQNLLLRLGLLVLPTCAFATHAADFTLRTSSTIVVPTTRGAANTTWFGWDSFGNISDPIDDTTPDIGTTTTGVRFRTLSGTDHTSSSGNFYSFDNPANEEVTVVTNGTPGSAGKTTVIAQLVTLFGGFAAPWVVGEINGVKPVAVVQGPNSAGRGQLWAMWELPGNAETYVFTLTGVPGGTMYSFDKIEIDTFYDPLGGLHPDSMVLAPPADFTLNRESGMVTPTTPRSPRHHALWVG